MEPELRNLALVVLRRLCGKIGHLPESYLLSEKIDLSGRPCSSGDFADVCMGVFKGMDVAVESLRVSEVDDKWRIRRVGNQVTSSHPGSLTHHAALCKKVVMWKNLSHPNILDLIGVPDTLEDGRFLMVSEWMAGGNIMEYVRKNAGNYLKLVSHDRIFLCHLLTTLQLADAAKGLKYLHDANIVHGDLKGVSIPVRIPRTPLMLFRPIFSSRIPILSRHASRIFGSCPSCTTKA